MRAQRSEILRGLIGTACVVFFATYAFAFSGDAPVHRSVAETPTAQFKPTTRDLTFFERRLRKASRDSRFAKTCGNGQLIGGTEVHVAMSFPPLDAPATREAPGLARAVVEKTEGAPKALVLESKDPTIWTVTGAPAVIVLLGESVIADYPEGTPVFAPRFTEICEGAAWTRPPRNWTFPQDQDVMSSLIDDVEGRFDNRAQIVANRLFNRRAASWRVQRGEAVMAF